MREAEFLKEEDFSSLVPKIEQFAKDTSTPFYQHTHEVSLSLMESKYLTVVGKKDGEIVAYLCGFSLNKYEFMIQQTYSEDPKLTIIMGDFLIGHLKPLGTNKLFILFKHNPRAAERHGFRIERYAMVREI